MDVLEEDKLKWIEDIKPTENLKTNLEAYNARFDFEGNLLDYKENVKTEGLYHHGEEPDRPGYTIQELLHLSRSSILQQRMTSINTLANILHKSDTYNLSLNSPIKPQLIDNNVYLILRFSLDDRSFETYHISHTPCIARTVCKLLRWTLFGPLSIHVQTKTTQLQCQHGWLEEGRERN